MQSFTGKVAVVTGAASGIGLAMAKAFAAKRMKVVMSDIEEAPLHAAAQALRTNGAEVHAVRTDVSKLYDVQALANESVATFGKVHVLCNNAGVAHGGLLTETTMRDWEWVLGVNLWGVIYGVQTFLPHMLAHGEEGHIVNTASVAGLISGPGMGIYSVAKHAVVSLSETIYHETKLMNAQIGVSVLCPGWVNTGIADSARNRPSSLSNENTELSPLAETIRDLTRQIISHGMPPEKVAEHVLAAIQQDTFYVLTHPELMPAVRMRAESILNGAAPAFVPPPGFDVPAVE